MKTLAQIAAELMGVSGVRLYHDQALYKEPSGGITPWHADQFYWPLATPKTVTAWIPLQATPMHMGPLAFAEKSQTVEIGRDIEISDDSEKVLSDELQRMNFSMNDTPFELGEVSFHAGWTFHRAGPNTADVPRRVMTIIYMDKDQTVAEPRPINRSPKPRPAVSAQRSSGQPAASAVPARARFRISMP